MRATLLLCDFAEAVNGKLYIMGGGWSRVVGSQPFNVAVAVKLNVPWTDTNQPHELIIQIVDDDGRPVVPDGAEEPMRVSGQFEVGRPVGLRPGTELDMVIAPTFQGVKLNEGIYRVELIVDGQPSADVTFEVVKQ